MRAARPLMFVWDGDRGVMVPGNPIAASRMYESGGHYVLVDSGWPSDETRAHFFAVIAHGWHSLPPALAVEFASPEALRKRLLILAGHRDEKAVAFVSREEAERFAARLRALDGYALIAVRGTVVASSTAKSIRDLDARRFHNVKSAALDILAGWLNVSVKDLAESGRRGQ
jgi:hypothetical protein